ncbi:hypothetical protein BKA93DRAFT_845573 [Sparassis latifolia]
MSLTNPWLNFFLASTVHSLANELNNDLKEYCSTSPTVSTVRGTTKCLYRFRLLLFIPDVPITSLVDTVKQITKLVHLKGIILSTHGVGKGLNDQSYGLVWSTIIAEAGLIMFLHPHYGVDGKEWGREEQWTCPSSSLGLPL